LGGGKLPHRVIECPGRYQVSVETARSGVGPEISKHERKVQATRQDLREALKKATGQVKARIDYLDRIDRGNAA